MIDLFKLLFLVLVFNPNLSEKQSMKEISSIEAHEIISKEQGWIVLDVRTVDEYELGHIKGAKLIDIRDPLFLSKIQRLDRQSNYIVHCRTSNRSRIAIEQMQNQGFKNLYLIKDGMIGWEKNKLPVED